MRTFNMYFVAVGVTLLAMVGFAQETGAEKSVIMASDANRVPAFPYVAEITGDDVYVRSGPGTNYYHCGKLDKGKRVTVVGSQFSWSQIVPPPGSFSWISMRFVRTSHSDPNIGVVTGNNVRVYAGSDFVEPMHSTSLQGKLDRDDKVILLGEQKDDYYKIAPPESAYLWVSTNYTKALGGVGEVSPADMQPVDVQPDDVPPVTGSNSVVPTATTPEARKLEKFYAIESELRAEQHKPVDEQNYEDIKKSLSDLANDRKAGKAARYAQFLLRRAERIELALKMSKTVDLQDLHLQKVRERIEYARAKRLAELEDLGRYAAVGKFQTSKIYGTEQELIHYRITDDSGKKILCYAVPASKTDLSRLNKFVGRKVGLVGTIEPHVETAGALVRFTEIVALKK